MIKFAVMGGGRWSRVIISVLHELYGDKMLINWITAHGYEAVKQWLDEQPFTHIKIIKNRQDMMDVDGAIVATAVKNHSEDALFFLKKDIPVLIEKPFSLTPQQVNEITAALMSGSHNLFAGVNHEFIYASYLHDFCKHLKGVTISSVQIQWMDPSAETRYGEEKKADLKTPITDDILPHVLSIISLIRPLINLNLESVIHKHENEKIITMRGNSGEIIDFQLSRISDKRVRFISINDGDYEIDFSEEPGKMSIKDKTINNEWRGGRPLGTSLESFVFTVKNPETASDWPLNTKNFVDHIKLLDEVRAR